MTGLLIAGLVGQGISAYGAIKAGKAAKKAGQLAHEAKDSEAELEDYNAGVADLQADDAVLRGQMEEDKFRGAVRGAIGTQRAGIASGNIDVSYGSAVDVQADAARLGELDALTIRTNARREAWGYQVTAYDYRKGAEITRKEGVNLQKAGKSQGNAAYISGAANVIGGTTSLLGARYGFGGGK